MSVTEEQVKDWERYELVMLHGRWNMFSPEAQMATGLSKERYMFCIMNYQELKAAATVGQTAKRKHSKPELTRRAGGAT